MASSLWLASCYQGEFEAEATAGPPLRLLSAYPSPGDGIACPAADCGFPVDGVLEFRFDRYLLPETVARQAVRLYSGSPEVWQFVEPIYDLVERVVAFRPLRPLEPGAVYTVQLHLPTEEEPEGFRAFDGALLAAEGSAPLEYSFRTRPEVAGSGTGVKVALPPTDCGEVLRRFQSGCGGGACHGDRACVGDGCRPPAAGLKLVSTEGWLETAIAVPATQTMRDGRPDVTLEAPMRFGVGMPLIDASRAANSYLLYKLVANRGNYVGRDGRDVVSLWHAPVPPSGLAPSPEEVARLADWFLLAEPMPPGAEHVDLETLRSVQWWIGEGAPTQGCE